MARANNRGHLRHCGIQSCEDAIGRHERIRISLPIRAKRRPFTSAPGSEGSTASPVDRCEDRPGREPLRRTPRRIDRGHKAEILSARIPWVCSGLAGGARVENHPAVRRTAALYLVKSWLWQERLSY